MPSIIYLPQLKDLGWDPDSENGTKVLKKDDMENREKSSLRSLFPFSACQEAYDELKKTVVNIFWVPSST